MSMFGMDEPTTISPTSSGGIGGIDLPEIGPRRPKDADIRPAVVPVWLVVIAFIAFLFWLVVRKFI